MPSTIDITFDSEKFRELLLYIAQRSVEDPRFGATKLNKILFYADFYHYGLYGAPITGATYQRLNRGPAPRQMLPVQRSLVEASDAYVVTSMYFGRQQKRLLALREPDLSRFSAEEIALVDRIIEVFRKDDARGLSELSHQEIGWMAASSGEEIPYEAVFLSSREPSPGDVMRARELAEQYGWHEATPSN